MSALNPPERSAVPAAVSTLHMLTEFYCMTLPDKGRPVLFQKGPSGGGKHTFFAEGDYEGLAAATVERGQGPTDLYYGTATYGEADRRTAENAMWFKALRIDIDCGPEKYAKDPENSYPLLDSGMEDAELFVSAIGLQPSVVVGSGYGLHIYWCFDKPTGRDKWMPLSEAMARALAQHGVKVDKGVTADAARVLRPPGTINFKYGRQVPVTAQAGSYTYTFDELQQVLAPWMLEPLTAWSKPTGGELVGPNGDVLLPERRDRDANAIIEGGCIVVGDLRDGKPNQDYDDWCGGLRLLTYCENGEALAHEWSAQAGDYKPGETQQKLDSFTHGPPRCGTLPACKGCRHNGTLSTALLLSDRVQRALSVVEVSPDGEAQTRETDTAQPSSTPGMPAVIAEMNERHAVVGRGSDYAILDRRYPRETPGGVAYGIGWRSVAWVNQMYGTRFVRTGRAGDKPVKLSAYWLSHPQRAQYPDGEVFMPEGVAPAGTFNSWQGFAVVPRAGDVEPFIRLLKAMIADVPTRRYVMQWFALKAQRPGSVPDTILVCTGPKGSGKNSMIEPFLRMFGPHAALFDNSEQFVGRFNAHHRSLCIAGLDEAVFIGDPRQADAIKARVTARTTTYEAKGVDPVQGVNRCAYVMLTNHLHAWQSTVDERRAVIVETTSTLCGDRTFWRRYHAWLDGDGPAHLLHCLQSLDLSAFEPRDIPRGEALRRQTELTALRDPAVAWWNGVLSEGVMSLRDHRIVVPTEGAFEVSKTDLREAFELSARGRGNADRMFGRLKGWVGEENMTSHRPRATSVGPRLRFLKLPPLPELRARFTEAEHIAFDHRESDAD